MEFGLSFLFRKKLYRCKAFLDASDFPYYVFVLFKDADLINEFGDEVSIKTDGINVLPRADDNDALIALRRSLLQTLRYLEPFRQLVNTAGSRSH